MFTCGICGTRNILYSNTYHTCRNSVNNKHRKLLAFLNYVNFNDNISKWDISKAVNLDRMVFACKKFNGDLSNQVGRVESDNLGLSFTVFNGDISKWDVNKVMNIYGLFFADAKFNRDVSKWDVTKVTNLDAAFVLVRNTSSSLGTLVTSLSVKQRLCGRISGRSLRIR